MDGEPSLYGPNGKAVASFLAALANLSERQWIVSTQITEPLVAALPLAGESMNEYCYTRDRIGQLAVSVHRSAALVHTMQAVSTVILRSRAAGRAGLGVPARFNASKRLQAADARVQLAIAAASALMMSDLISMSEFANQYAPFALAILPVDVIVQGQRVAISPTEG